MKKYLVKCVALALAVLLPFVLWFGYLFSIPDHRGGTIASTIRYKTDLLQTTDGPRVIFAGGSSSPYGTNCAQAAQAFGRNTICVGATAYLGLPFYIRLLDQYAQPGDVVVLAPEHSLLQGENINYSLVWEAAGHDPDVWKTVPLSYYPGLFSSSVEYYHMKQAALEKAPSSYHADFGPLGDVITPRTTLLESGYNTQDPIDLVPGSVYQENIDCINRFAHRMENKGVTVLFAFAPTDKLAVTSSPEEIAAFGQVVADAVDIPVILPLDKALMDGAYFYDSNNHLTTEGAAINTENLIQGVLPYLAAS